MTLMAAAVAAVLLGVGATDASAQWTPYTRYDDVRAQSGGEALYIVDEETTTVRVKTSFEPTRIDPGEGFTFHMELVALEYNSEADDNCTSEHHAASEPYLVLAPGADWWYQDDEQGWDLWWDAEGETDAVVECTQDGDDLVRKVDWTHVVRPDATEDWDTGCFQAHTDDLLTQYSLGIHQTGSVATLTVGNPSGGCASKACSDLADSDNDGLPGWGTDPGCLTPDDPNEHEFGLVCDDGLDNDYDNFRDYRLSADDPVMHPDPGCDGADDPSEGDSACSDGLDNDHDGNVDFPDDYGCADLYDGTEAPEPECSDGKHNDADGKLDMADPGCTHPRDDSEYEPVLLRVFVEGPGAVRNETLGRVCEVFCTYTVDLGTTVSLRAQEVAPDGFLGWDSCSPFAGPSCPLRVTRNTTITARFDPVTGYAPWMNFHPDEKRWPMDPATFIDRSSLVWVRLDRRDCKDGRTQKVKRGRIDAFKLGHGGYRYRHCVRLPLTAKKKYTTYDTGDYTSPSRSKSPKGSPNGRTGFLLDLDDDARNGSKPKHDKGPPMYVEYEPDRYVIYWFFYGHNNVKSLKGAIKDRHEGDWEHIVVRLGAGNRATAVAYYQHYCGGDIFSWSEMERKGFLTDETHPRVYVAKGAHASYPNTGWKPFSCGRIWKGAGDKVAKGPVTWRTWARGSDAFKRADAQPWYGFGGGWGDIADSTTVKPGPFWGPLGPGPLKLKDGSLPKGW